MKTSSRLIVSTITVLWLYSAVPTQSAHASRCAPPSFQAFRSERGQEPTEPQSNLSQAIDRRDLQAVKVLLAKENKEGKAFQGYVEKINAVGERLYDENRFKDSLDWHLLAAEYGNGRSEANIGYMYLNGKGVTKSDDEALKWFRRSVAHNSSFGYADLGYMYENGRGGLPRSLVEAVRLYRIAAAAGLEYAKEQLTRLDIGDESALITAVTLGDLPEIQKLLQAQPNDVNMQDRKGASLLLLATLKGYREVVGFLVSLGARVDLQDNEGEFPLLAAIAIKRKDIVDEIMKAHPDVNLADRAGDTALAQAFVKRQPEIVRQLIKAGADVNKKTRGGGTALHWSVPESNIPAVADNLKLVLDAGADLEAKEDHGLTPLMLSLDSRDLLTTTALLIQRGADVNTRDAKGDTPLMIASLGGFLPQVELLLKHGAHLDDVNEAGWTSLMLATEQRHREIVRDLIDAGANVEITDKNGASAITRAVQIGDQTLIDQFINSKRSIAASINREKRNQEFRQAVLQKNLGLVSQLLASGVDVDASNSQGITPLMLAIREADSAILRLLLQAKANVNRESIVTPLMAAAATGNAEIVNLLIQAGAKVDTKDKDGRTALLYATTFPDGARSPEVVALLIKAGADVNVKDSTGLDSITGTCIQRLWTITQQLQRAGAKGEDGSCAFLAASALGSVADVEGLLQSGINVNIQEKNTKRTALHVAVSNHRLDIASALLKAGAKADVEDLNGETVLTYAVKNNDINAVKELLKSKVDLNQQIKEYEGGTVLHLAVRKYHTEIVQVLLGAGADPNARDDEQRTPLMIASYAPVFQALIKAGAKVDVKDKNRWTPLMHALADTYFGENRDLSPIRTLIDLGVDTNVKDEQGRTPLIVALENPSTGVREMVGLLLNAGSKVEGEIGVAALSIASQKEYEGEYHGVVTAILSRRPKLNQEEWTNVLVSAASNGNTELMNAAINGGADIHVVDGRGRTLLMVAATTNAATVQTLLSHKVEINSRDSAGNTALIEAAQFGCVECIRLLLNAGAEPNVQNNEGNTPLILALDHSYPRVEAVAALLRGRAKSDIVNKEGDNALLVAASVGAADVVQLLLQTGAAVDTKDASGKTPLIRAVVARSGYYPAPDLGADVIRKLLKARADINAVDDEGTTALILAARKGYLDLVRLLLQAGAKTDVRTNDGTNALIEVLNAHDEEIQSLDPIPRLTPAAQIAVAEELIKGGIDVNSKTQEGVTPLMSMAFRGQAKLVALLLKSGAKVNEKNDQGWTALMLAAGQGNAEVVRLLLNAHADPRIKDANGNDALTLAQSNNHSEIVEILKQTNRSP
jgi:ankyrin repeat protein